MVLAWLAVAWWREFDVVDRLWEEGLRDDTNGLERQLNGYSCWA
jgi:hypothetical protein